MSNEMTQLMEMMKQMQEDSRRDREVKDEMIRIMAEENKQMKERLAKIEEESEQKKKKKGPRTDKKVWKSTTKTAPIKETADFKAFMDALKPKYKLLAWVGIATNLRISDLLKLTYGDIAYGENRIIESKTHKVKEIDPLATEFSREIVPLLQQLGIHKDSDFLFASNKKDENGNPKPISRQQAWNALKDGAVKAGLRVVNEDGKLIQGIGIRIGTHTLRKTFAYWFLQEDGNDIVQLARLLNHSNPKVTEEYIGLEQEELKSLQKQAIGGFYQELQLSK